jgi:pimeloyl-ACP methyl ester carboxylesterase
MKTKNIVLIHGAFADGSSWSSVIQRLQMEGYTVTAPQFPLTTLEADLARLRQVLAVQSGPTLVVGHSYGGQIMTALGPDAPNVAGLVYVAAFGLDQGESIGALNSQYPPPSALAHLRVDAQGFALAFPGGFRKTLRIRCGPGQSQRHVRSPAAGFPQRF